ncbi:ecdysteroid-phosphate phosphatase-like isoform X1 [Tachypleus tridentatus]|uniref:ecdysteroid-phosphate phosphatase-like isoform X1 n=2 Tax=Tachypleus tridentatus TaxID=6853 RepID=UPI003FD3AD4E
MNMQRKLFIIRHAERVDFTFGAWIPKCFDCSGNYFRQNLNMPPSVPVRSGGPQAFFKDCPLTNIGLHQATLTGEALKEANTSFDGVYSSPSLRCIQTCTNVLKGMGQSELPVNLEPGLFEWLGWYQDGMPEWMTTEELKNCCFNINEEYKPVITENEIRNKNESGEEYYMRSYYVTQTLLEKSCQPGQTLLFVGHAATLDTCTRQLTGNPPRSSHDIVHRVYGIPYCAVATTEEDENGKWTLVCPPVLPLTHTANVGFDWKHLL